MTGRASSRILQDWDKIPQTVERAVTAHTVMAVVREALRSFPQDAQDIARTLIEVAQDKDHKHWPFAVSIMVRHLDPLTRAGMNGDARPLEIILHEGTAQQFMALQAAQLPAAEPSPDVLPEADEEPEL